MDNDFEYEPMTDEEMTELLAEDILLSLNYYEGYVFPEEDIDQYQGNLNDALDDIPDGPAKEKLVDFVKDSGLVVNK